MDGLDIFNIYFVGSIEMFTILYFLTRFLGKKVKFIYYFICVFLGMAVIYFFENNYIVKLLIYILILMGWGFFICRVRNIFVGLYSVVMIGIMNLCYGAFNSVSCIMAPLFFEKNSGIIGLLFMIMGSILAVFTAVLCYCVMNKYFIYSENVGMKYVLIILMPILLIFIAGEYVNLNIYGNTVTIHTSGSLSDIRPFAILFMQILGIISVFCVMFAYKKLMESFKLNKKLCLLEQEKNSLNKYVQEAKMRYDKTKSFRHDIKNHMMVVKELLHNGNVDKALGYMGDMENLMYDMQFSVNTNNPVLDILLGNKLGIAQNNQIQVQCKFVCPYPCEITDIDLCIIFANALDNAIAGCNCLPHDREKYIYINGKMQGDFWFIEISNSYIKEKDIRVGTGLSNIKAVVEKYHGAVNMRTDGDMFVLSILLIIPRQSDDISQQIS